MSSHPRERDSRSPLPSVFALLLLTFAFPPASRLLAIAAPISESKLSSSLVGFPGLGRDLS